MLKFEIKFHTFIFLLNWGSSHSMGEKSSKLQFTTSTLTDCQGLARETVAPSDRNDFLIQNMGKYDKNFTKKYFTEKVNIPLER